MIKFSIERSDVPMNRHFLKESARISIGKH